MYIFSQQQMFLHVICQKLPNIKSVNPSQATRATWLHGVPFPQPSVRQKRTLQDHRHGPSASPSPSPVYSLTSCDMHLLSMETTWDCSNRLHTNPVSQKHKMQNSKNSATQTSSTLMEIIVKGGKDG